jgi:hydroxymethylbilane synthase
MEKNNRTIKIGTRGSELALAQTNLVIDQIHRHYPDVTCEIIIIKTMGDKILDKPLLEFGGKGAFVTEFEDAILRNDIDLAIHSSKDMPMELAKGLEIMGVLTREDPRDVLITRKDTNLEQLETAVVGTSSLRRQHQIEQLYPNIHCTSLRGNVNTRLRKLSEGEYDAIILAAAGLRRLNLESQEAFRYRYLSYEEMVPAAGQGIIAIEGRGDTELNKIIKSISDPKAGMELEIERKALQLLEAGCHEPIGIFSEIIGNQITIRMMKAKDDTIIKLNKTTALGHRMSLVECMVKQILEEC